MKFSQPKGKNYLTPPRKRFSKKEFAIRKQAKIDRQSMNIALNDPRFLQQLRELEPSGVVTSDYDLVQLNREDSK